MARVPLAQWAEKNDVPYRTAWGMIRRGVLAGGVIEGKRMFVDVADLPAPAPRGPERVEQAETPVRTVTKVPAKPPKPLTLGQRIDAMLEGLEESDSPTAAGVHGLLLQLLKDTPDDDPDLDTNKRANVKLGAIREIVNLMKIRSEAEGERDIVSLLHDIAERAPVPMLPARAWPSETVDDSGPTEA